MTGKSADGRRSRQTEHARVAALPPGAEARFARRMALLLGLVPLTGMTQAEADWLFEQKVLLTGDH